MKAAAEETAGKCKPLLSLYNLKVVVLRRWGGTLKDS